MKKFLDKPFRLLSVFGCIYMIITIALNLLTGFTYSDSIFPYAELISYFSELIVIILFVLTYFLCDIHYLYYIGVEILIFSNLYAGRIYASLFLSSILLVILVTEKKIITKRNLIIYAVIEIVKMIMVIPYGVSDFFNYIGLSLFYLCTVGCMNLLFRHAYSKKDSLTLNLDDYKFTERQKDCIKETVLNNITIKALALNHNVSESTIKKDLAHIYNELGIVGKADLKALFIDYKFE